ncbi:hypothetical protein VNO77_18089 [Canavalia gladiata]|uniref:Uncharacterized protein n=1 Tax=Canavalia gladiata TaxID=3824 RepID=A0AAN9LK37_CANGL
MGNQISFGGSDGRGKIVYWDGSVEEFDKPLTVAEVMLEHPQHVVVELLSAVNQKRPIPLPADKKLEMKKTYVMLPLKPGKPVVLSSEDSRRILFIVNSMSSSGFLPWLARLFHTKNAAIGDLSMLKRKKEVESTQDRNGFSEFLPEMLEERAEYMSRQLSGKGWKPSLDTIKEKKVKTKMPHWLFFKSLI